MSCRALVPGRLVRGQPPSWRCNKSAPIVCPSGERTLLAGTMLGNVRTRNRFGSRPPAGVAGGPDLLDSPFVASPAGEATNGESRRSGPPATPAGGRDPKRFRVRTLPSIVPASKVRSPLGHTIGALLLHLHDGGCPRTSRPGTSALQDIAHRAFTDGAGTGTNDGRHGHGWCQ